MWRMMGYSTSARPHVLLRFLTEMRHSAAAPPFDSITVAMTSTAFFSPPSEKPFQRNSSRPPEVLTERVEGEWLVSQRIFDESPFSQNFMAHSPTRRPSGVPSPKRTHFPPSLFFIARQSKPRSLESNSILIPLPSRTCAADVAAQSRTEATNTANLCISLRPLGNLFLS